MTSHAETGILAGMSFEIVPAFDISMAEQARIGNAAFAGYVGGWTEINAETNARFLCTQGADLYYSRFVRRSDRLAGFGYVNRINTVLRLAGMAILPEARGSGAAGFLLEHLLDEAKERGDRLMMLEVIEQNPRAHRFYLGHGFEEVDRLFGWRRAAATPLSVSTDVKEVNLLDALWMPNAHEYPQLPWQVSCHSLAKAGATRAYRAGSACVVLGDLDVTPIHVLGFLGDAGGSTPWDALRAILTAILARFPDREFLAAPKFPAACGEQIFAPLGFAREPISQFLMRRELAPAFRAAAVEDPLRRNEQ
jgi:GNAT superfamily N-acetyltransferase